MGFRYVELAGQYRQGASFIALLKELGLQVSGSHVGMDELENETEVVLAAHEALGCRSLIMPWIHPDTWRNENEALRIRMEKQSDALAARGFSLSYHNHDFEIAGDLLLNFFRLSSRSLKAQFDIAWVQYGGGNPASYIREFGSRVESVHLKDTTGVAGSLDCVAGTGLVDWNSVLSACSDVGVPFGVIEMDAPPGDALESVRGCFEFFNSHRVA
jgi:sugar phosphate isomerase/epimerase